MKTKNAGLAVLLGAIIPGAGHIYVERYGSGIWYLALYLIIFPGVIGGWMGYTIASASTSDGFLILIAILALIAWLFSLYSVYVDAQRFNEKAQRESKKCPHCAEFVKAEANTCRYCHQSV
ncbi:MAG: hypothetical protein A2075_12010 [Geobacteraceae bacterium GWC2_58_44]|nr:MAG: hypothetical protein A2075_12010 [Geobacteraceae bacterium GWC2_58_44]HBG06287.1 hypothetical protein [Geobacter sp.]